MPTPDDKPPSLSPTAGVLGRGPVLSVSASMEEKRSRTSLLTTILTTARIGGTNAKRGSPPVAGRVTARLDG